MPTVNLPGGPSVVEGVEEAVAHTNLSARGRLMLRPFAKRGTPLRAIGDGGRGLPPSRERLRGGLGGGPRLPLGRPPNDPLQARLARYPGNSDESPRSRSGTRVAIAETNP
jgi:hypothetical protein